MRKYEREQRTYLIGADRSVYFTENIAKGLLFFYSSLSALNSQLVVQASLDLLVYLGQTLSVGGLEL